MSRAADVGARIARDATIPEAACKSRVRQRVVAGILIDAQTRVLLAERVNDPSFAGLWEFPGGKIGAAESSDAALRRELREELDIDTVCFEPLLTVAHAYADRDVEIEFFLVTEWRNDPRPLLDQRLRWVPVALLVPAELMPANVAVIEALFERTVAGK